MTRCSFCNKPQNEEARMIAGPAGVFICDACVTTCKNILDKDLKSAELIESQNGFHLATPQEM